MSPDPGCSGNAFCENRFVGNGTINMNFLDKRYGNIVEAYDDIVVFSVMYQKHIGLLFL